MLGPTSVCEPSPRSSMIEASVIGSRWRTVCTPGQMYQRCDRGELGRPVTEAVGGSMRSARSRASGQSKSTSTSCPLGGPRISPMLPAPRNARATSCSRSRRPSHPLNAGPFCPAGTGTGAYPRRMYHRAACASTDCRLGCKDRFEWVESGAEGVGGRLRRQQQAMTVLATDATLIGRCPGRMSGRYQYYE